MRIWDFVAVDASKISIKWISDHLKNYGIAAGLLALYLKLWGMASEMGGLGFFFKFSSIFLFVFAIVFALLNVAQYIHLSVENSAELKPAAKWLLGIAEGCLVVVVAMLAIALWEGKI